MYRVTRRDYIRRRPDWMKMFLLYLNPTLYQWKPTLHEAKSSLRKIHDAVVALGIPGYKGRLRISVTSSTLLITNHRGKSCLRFSIEKGKR